MPKPPLDEHAPNLATAYDSVLLAKIRKIADEGGIYYQILSFSNSSPPLVSLKNTAKSFLNRFLLKLGD